MASYLWSKLEGSYDGHYFPDYYGQQMPNLSAAYDYGELTVHNDGYLSNDRRHQAKVAAVHVFPFRLTAGASAYYRSGTPLPSIARGTPCASLVSPDNAVTCNSAFNTTNAWQDPRSVRLGVRITF